MVRCWGAAGFMSDAAFKKMNQLMRDGVKAADARLREEIRALSNQDIQKIMARKIVEAATARGCVVKADMDIAGLPPHRVEANKDAAFRLARRIYPKLDAIGDMPWAA